MQIKITDDFDLEKIADSGQCFRWRKLADSAYDIVAFGKSLRIERATDAGVFTLSCQQDEYDSLWRQYFDLETDYRAIRESIAGKHPFADAAADFGQGIRIIRQEPWETLVTFIISQRRSIPSIKTAVEKLSSTAGTEGHSASGEIYHTFPTAEQMARMTDSEWAGCRLGYREKYLRSVAGLFAEGTSRIDSMHHMTDEELLRDLKSLYGVGEKIAKCVMLFGFHRLDAFPVDVWIKRILEGIYHGGYEASLFHPYNGIVQQYFYYWCLKNGTPSDGDMHIQLQESSISE